MKIKILALTFLFYTTYNPLHAFDLTPIVTSPQAISSKLQADCLRVFGIADADSCSRGAKRMKQVLEKTEGDAKTSYLIFREKTLELLESSQGQKLLALVDPYIQSGQPFHLWKLVLKFFPNKKEALLATALLFQDASEQRLHIQKLAELAGENSAALEKVQLLDSAISKINSLEGKSWRNHKRKHTLYPEEVDSLLYGSSFYHFYVSAFIAEELTQEGTPPRVAAFFAGFFNYYYEFYSRQGAKGFLWYSKAKPFNKYDAADIQLGFCGAFYGVKIAHKCKEISLPALVSEKKIYLQQILSSFKSN